MSGACTCPIAFLGGSASHKSAIVQQLAQQPRRQIFRQSTNRKDDDGRSALSFHNATVTLEKPIGKVTVPLWDFNPDPAFACVHHLLLSQPCASCVVCLDTTLSDDAMAADAVKWILEFRRNLLVQGDKRIPVHLVALRNTSDPSSMQASPDWKRVSSLVHEAINRRDGTGYRRFLHLNQTVIETTANHNEDVMLVVRTAAKDSIETMQRLGLLEKAQQLRGKMEVIRKECSLFIVPLEEFQACARSRLRGVDEVQLKKLTERNGQVVLVERQGWLPHVIVNPAAMAAAFGRLLVDADLQHRHSQHGFLSFMDIAKVFDKELKNEQLSLFLTVLQDLSFAFEVGVHNNTMDMERDWCIPLLNTIRREGVKWLLSQTQLRTAVNLQIPSAELFARIQVALSRLENFGPNNVQHWQNSCKLKCLPQVLMCGSADHNVIAWEVASPDDHAQEVHRRVRDIVLEQCQQHMPHISVHTDDTVSDEYFELLIRQSDDGVHDAIVDGLATELRNMINVRDVDEGPCITAGGDILKPPLAEPGVSVPIDMPPAGDWHTRGVRPDRTPAAPPPAAPAPTAPVPASMGATASSSSTMASTRVALPAAYSPAAPPLTTNHVRSSATPTVATVSIGTGQPVIVGSSSSAVSSDGSMGSNSTGTPDNRQSISSPSLSDDIANDSDDDRLEPPPLSDDVTLSPGHHFISDMASAHRRALANELDSYARRGWRDLMEYIEFDRSVEDEIEQCTDRSRTMMILDRASDMGLSINILAEAMAQRENHDGVKIIAQAREELIAVQLLAEDRDAQQEDPPRMTSTYGQSLPCYTETAQHHEEPPPAYQPPYRPDAKPTYGTQVPAGAKLVLISYHWESDDFASKVAWCCEWLRGEGIDVRCDQFEKECIRNHPGGLLGWKEEMYSRAQMVLVFGSRGYVQAAMDHSSPEPCLSALEQLPNYPCGCDVRTEYSRLLAHGFAARRFSPVPVILHQIVQARRQECLPILLQSPGSYKIPGNEFGLICRLTDRNPVPRPPVQRQRPEFRPRPNPFSQSVLRNGFAGQDGPPPPVNHNHPFRLQPNTGPYARSRRQQQPQMRH